MLLYRYLTKVRLVCDQRVHYVQRGRLIGFALTSKRWAILKDNARVLEFDIWNLSL